MWQWFASFFEKALVSLVKRRFAILSVKLLRSIYPVIDGVSGSTVSIQVGASMFPDSPPTWQAAQTFTVGTDVKIDSFATGRYLSIRFSNADYSPWRIRSFRVDYVNQGLF